MVVIWTEDAITQFRAAYEYILENAGKNVAKRIANKNYKLVYHIENQTIYISALFDCRQNPTKLKDIKKHR